jgi:glycosyltransferase involved in cell wall biosynthesis
MIGEGELREEVEQKIQHFGMENQITLCGFQKNPYAILNRAKVLCMPSEWEGFGLAAVEALTLGKPIVVAPVGGLAKIVTDACGKLCTEKEAYIDELYALLTNEKYYETKSVGALKRAHEYDNLREYKNMLLEIYKG